MKKIVKKNQVVLTVLAVMIAVAGYLTYAGSDGLLPVGVNQETAETGAQIDEVSNEEILSENMALENAGQTAQSAQAQEGEGEDNAQESASEGESGETPDGTPGEAVLTNSEVVDFMAEVQLNREQVRTKNKEALMEIINNETLGEEQKKEAVETMVKLTDNAQKENATETLLGAKGFENTVVSIDDDGVDVVIGRTELTDAERAQIEDIVKRKAEVEADSIVITLMNPK